MAATNPPVIQCKDYDYKRYRQTKTSHLYKERGGSLNRVLQVAMVAAAGLIVGACEKERSRDFKSTAYRLKLEN